MDDLTKEVIINNEYDYSNIIPNVECIGYLLKYCNDVYTKLLQLIEDDHNKNEKLKYEFRDYSYHKHYATCFEVMIYLKNTGYFNCTTYESYVEYVRKDNLKNIRKLEIKLDLSYKSGTEKNLIEYKNTFKINFAPYDIVFIRNSNHNDNNMDSVENTIKQILGKFPVANSIFCTK